MNRLVRRAFCITAAAMSCGVVWPAVAGASPANHPAYVGGVSYTPVHLVARGQLAKSKAGKHFLYVDDGNPGGGGGGADSIEVFRLSGKSVTPLQTFTSGANQNYAFFGSNTLALRKGGKGNSACLVLTDAGNDMLRSYSVSSSGSNKGQIVAQVSALADPNGYIPEQVTIASNGKWAFMVDTSAYISTWSLASNCTLAFASSSTGATDFPNYSQAVPIGSSQLVATDDANNKIDTYTINASTGQLSWQASTTADLNQPDGLTTSGSDLFMGGLTNPTTLAADKLASGGSIQRLTGSPAHDASAPYGVPVLFDSKNSNAIEGDEGQVSLLSNFHVSSSGISSKGETSLQAKGEYTNDLVPYGTTVFVDGVVNGDIENCALGGNGATSCATVAVLANPGGYSSGLQVL